MIGFVTEMLGYPFMRRAFLAGLFIGVIAPLIGTYLVHRQMAFIGDTLAHSAFAGVAVGLFLGSAMSWELSPYLTALVVAVLAALLIEVISDYTGAYGDVSMAIVLSGGFAIGTVLVSLSGGISVSINQYLFGNISTVQPDMLQIMGGLSFLVVAVVAATHKQLLYITFDEEAARVARFNVDAYNKMLVMLTALVIVAAMQIMGVILVAALLVVPVAAAAQIARSFTSSLLYGVVIAEISVLVGITLSYAYDLAAGGTIVLVAIAIFGGAALVGRRTAVSAG